MLKTSLLKITVIVPTYKRPQDLARCLAALKLQIRPVDELWVIVRDTDQATWEFLEQFARPDSEGGDHGALPLHIATVTAVGVIAAMNIGLESSTGDIVAFTDDDAAPHPDWLAKIEDYYLADQDKKNRRCWWT